jgi:hypothetical protein
VNAQSADVAQSAATKREVIPKSLPKPAVQIGYAPTPKGAWLFTDFHTAAESAAVTARKTYCLCPVGVNRFIAEFRR